MEVLDRLAAVSDTLREQIGADVRPPGHIDGIYREFAPLMRRIASRKFGIPNADAEALVHDVFATYLAVPVEKGGLMRRVSIRRVGAVCILALLLSTAAMAADDPTPPTLFDRFVVWIMARIGGPGG